MPTIHFSPWLRRGRGLKSSGPCPLPPTSRHVDLTAWGLGLLKTRVKMESLPAQLFRLLHLHPGDPRLPAAGSEEALLRDLEPQV